MGPFMSQGQLLNKWECWHVAVDESLSAPEIKWEYWHVAFYWSMSDSLIYGSTGMRPFIGQCQLLKNGSADMLFFAGKSQSPSAKLECWPPWRGQFHTSQRAHQRAVTLWQCWLGCFEAEHYKGSSCLCSISILDRENVIIHNTRSQLGWLSSLVYI